MEKRIKRLTKLIELIELEKESIEKDLGFSIENTTQKNKAKIDKRNIFTLSSMEEKKEVFDQVKKLRVVKDDTAVYQPRVIFDGHESGGSNYITMEYALKELDKMKKFYKEEYPEVYDDIAFYIKEIKK